MPLNIGDRMKSNYEDRYRFYLTRRTPVIIRVDGRSFHTLTRKYFKKDYHTQSIFSKIMRETSLRLLRRVQSAKIAYVQSDEISLLLTDYEGLETEAWFDYNLNKIVSITSSIASVEFATVLIRELNELGIPIPEELPVFDSRAFNVPKEEVNNYFIFRQVDSMRNAIQFLGQQNFSPKQLNGKKCAHIVEMLNDIGIHVPENEVKYGTSIDVETHEYSVVVFTQNKEFVEKYL